MCLPCVMCESYAVQLRPAFETKEQSMLPEDEDYTNTVRVLSVLCFLEFVREETFLLHIYIYIYTFYRRRHIYVLALVDVNLWN